MGVQTFVLPDLGEGLTEAEIVRWLVAVGDEVTVDQSVVEVETAKSVVEVPPRTPVAWRSCTQPRAPPSTSASRSSAWRARGRPRAPTREGEAYREEERAGSGNVLIGYGTSGGVPSPRRRRSRAGVPAVHTHSPAPAGGVPRVVSPLVRRLAREAGVDLRGLAPSGPGGVIRKVDVERALGHAAISVTCSGPAAAQLASGASRSPASARRSRPP